ncbi:hypothetical protein [Candidatus Poriferisodalis sp.]|uniref:hypothetical protein n=1 Tax=Candidatus Poriferisodalis sp. TaxID=3101277 RepID=UPI003B01C847
MLPSVVCDAGGLLVVSGLLGGEQPEHAEVLALDWTSVTVGRFLAARHNGRAAATEAEIGLALAVVDEWFPVRSLVAVTMSRAGVQAADTLDSWSALVLAEHLRVPFFTASDEVTSDVVDIHHPW